jgi:hypothetical protein
VQFSVGQWREVGLSFTGDGVGDDWAYVYVDGKREGAFQPGTFGSEQVLYLGSGLSGANRFRGLFDHVEFWDEPVEETAFAELSNVAPSNLAGDYTGNGTVDAADFVVWRKRTGQLVAPATGADGTGNGLVDADDHALWRANYGRAIVPTVGVAAGSDHAASSPSAKHEPNIRQIALASPSPAGSHAFALIDVLARDLLESHEGDSSGVKYPVLRADDRDTLLLSFVSFDTRNVDFTNTQIGSTAFELADDAEDSNARSNLFMNLLADDLARELAIQIFCTTGNKR